MAGTKNSGRRSLREEMGVLERFSQLSPKVFKYLAECLDGDLVDKRWAIEWLKTGYVKMIPQALTGKDGKDLFPQPILGGLTQQNEDKGANKSIQSTILSQTGSDSASEDEECPARD